MDSNKISALSFRSDVAQLAPTMIQSLEPTLVEDGGKVSQLVVDMSVDDSVDEESEGVTHGSGRQWRTWIVRKRNRKCWFPER